MTYVSFPLEFQDVPPKFHYEVSDTVLGTNDYLLGFCSKNYGEEIEFLAAAFVRTR